MTQKLQIPHWFMKALVLFIGVIGPMSSDTYLPSLPEMTTYFGASVSMMQLTITFFFLGFSLSQLFYGPLSDQYGRKKILISGMVITLIGSIGCLFAETALQLITYRFIQGAGIASTMVIARSSLRDVFSGKDLTKAISHISIAFSITPVLAPILGGYLHDWFGWRATFQFIAIYAALVTLVAWFILPETNQQKMPGAAHPKTMAINFWTLMTDKYFMGYLLVASFAMAGMIAFTTISPFLLQNVLGYSPVGFAWLTMIIATSFITSRVINSILMYRFHARKLIFMATLIMISAGVFLFSTWCLHLFSAPILMIAASLFVFAGGIVMPNAMVEALNPYGHLAGSAAAIYGCLQLLGTFIASAIIAMISQHDQFVLSLVYIGLGISALLAHLCLIMPNQMYVHSQPEHQPQTA